VDPWHVDDVSRGARLRPLLCISDVHGDIDALDSVLDAAAHLPLCGIVAAGDHCLGGPDPFAVWQRLHDVGAHMVRGPSDLAVGVLRPRELSPRSAREEARLLTLLRTQEALGDIVCRRLAELPSTVVVSLDDTSGVMVMHGSPTDEYRALADDKTLPFEVACVAEDVLVVGATHRPFVRTVERRDSAPLLVVNAGSVGVSPHRADGERRTAHAVLLLPAPRSVEQSTPTVHALPRDVLVRGQRRARRVG
jgi:predicted phosphodiesterase